jgi:peptidoglycan glycosyltransferase
VNRRLWIVAGSLGLCFIVAAYFLTEKMILNREAYLAQRYTDVKFVTLMRELIQKGVFNINAEGTITADEVRLANCRLSKATENRVRKHIRLLHRDGNLIAYDKRAASIAGPANTVEKIVVRGMILDRNGEILAKSSLNEKNRVVGRVYPFGPIFLPVIGYDHPAYGRRNLEKILYPYLNGERHEPIYGKTEDPFRKRVEGDSVTLTLDSRLQRKAYELMAGRRGAVVVLDIKTGDILVAVSLPAFDPAEQNADKWLKAGRDSRNAPFENRAFAFRYPPGSAFKTVVAAAWLERQGKKQPFLHTVHCGGRNERKFSISCLTVHGHTDLAKGLRESCNIYFSDIGVVMGPAVLAMAERLGFNSRLPLLPNLGPMDYGTVESQAYRKQMNSNDSRRFTALDFQQNPKLIAQGAIGQTIIDATPLQMAIVAETIANDGVVMQTQLVKTIRTSRGAIIFEAKPEVLRRAMGASSARTLKNIMETVMTQGTGRHVAGIYLENGVHTIAPVTTRAQRVRVGGKTGTAEVGKQNGLPHSWFIGFAPVEKPRVAVAVVAEHEGFGSLVAAPVGMAIMAEALNQ